MNLPEFFVENMSAETPKFEKVFKALPKAKLNWRPHKRSRTAMELVSTLTFEAMWFPAVLKTGIVDMAKVKPPKTKTVSGCLKTFKSGMEEGKAIAARMTQADWDAPAKLVDGGTVVWETTRGGMAWGLLVDMIHHRGQLSVYIRPMGGKVPAIYGPSADETH